METNTNSRKHSERIHQGVPRELIILATTPFILLLLALFAGIGWAVLFTAFGQLIYVVLPYSNRLTRLVFGSGHDNGQRANVILRSITAASRVILIFMTAFLFLVAFYIINSYNYRIIEFFLPTKY